MRFAKTIGAALVLTMLAVPVQAADYNWQKEGTTVEMGDNLATLKVPAGMVYLNKEDTISYNKEIGNPPTGNEIGMVTSPSEKESWFVVFEYSKTGHIKDDEKADLDAKKLLESFKEGDKESNKEREKMGVPALNTIDWAEPPHYDEQTRNLTWALLLETSKGEKVINKNVRLLGREGYVSATLVADPQEIPGLKPQMDAILGNFKYKQSNRYEDYNPKTDKLAEYGLTALIAGGAGAVAAKTGLFAGILLALKKFAVVIVAAVVGGAGWLKKKLKKNKIDPPSFSS